MGTKQQVLFECANKINNYKCKTCSNFQSNSLVSLKIHIEASHSNKIPQEDVYQCLKCCFVTYSKYLMGRRSLFSECATSNEDERKKRFVWYRNAQSEFNLKLEKPETLFDEEQEDTRRFESRRGSIKLIAKLNREGPQNSCQGTFRDFSCKHCPYKCTSKQNLGIHSLIHHTNDEDIQWFRCNHCPTKFKLKQSLKIHILSRHTQPEYVQWFLCEECSYKSKRKGDLKKHIMFCHTKLEDIRWFECEHCPSKFKQNCHLLKHILFCHTQSEDIRWFSCDQCPHKFKLKSNLKQHITICRTKPKDIRWLKCEHCPSKFKKKHYLK